MYTMLDRTKKPRAAARGFLLQRWRQSEFRDHRSDALELVVQAGADDVVGEAIGRGDRDAARQGGNTEQRDGVVEEVGDVAEVDVEIFELGGEAAPELGLDADAGRPARPVAGKIRAGRAGRHRHGNRRYRGGSLERERVLHAPPGGAAGHVPHPRVGGVARTRPRGGEPVQPLLADELDVLALSAEIEEGRVEVAAVRRAGEVLLA